MPPDEPPDAPGPPPRPGPARRAAEPLAWWTALLAVYLALVSTISLTEIAVGASAAAAGAAAAVAARRALLTAGTDRRREGGPSAPAAPAAPVRLLAPPARLPFQIVADTARVIGRGASGGYWTTQGCPHGPAGRGAVTLLLSASPGAYVGGVDPERGLLRVHRLPGPSPFERSLRRTGLLDDPPAGGPGEGGPP